MIIPNLTNKTRTEILQLVETTEELVKRRRERYLDFIFPDSGQYSRDKYYKAMEFFESGKLHRFRMLGGANGSGKSFTGAAELVYHVTGNYPVWWKGKVQDNPKHWWIVAASGKTFKDSLQRLLVGDSLRKEDLGTGLIPKEQLLDYSGMQGVSGAVETILVKHKKGHTVTISVKSSDQQRENLQAANLDGVLFDEEPPIDIYTECVMRLRSSPTKPPGISLLLFTPLKGLSEVVLLYLKNGQYPQYGTHPDDPDKYVVRIEATDAPHLTEEDIRAYIANTPPHERDARLRGLPALGSGRVYPIAEEDIVVNFLKVAPHWPRAFGIDFGWNCTAAIWGAKDPETGIIYLYGEYYKGKQAPYAHAHALQQRGKWIPGICDPRGDKSSERDGTKLIDEYTSLGIELVGY